MAITKRLVMCFKAEYNSSMTLSIDDPGEDITEEEVKTVMDLVVYKNIFSLGEANIISSIYAKIATTNISDYDLVL